uniref:Uncharacterized protein n=1 Tax=Siphoviridae sp. ctrap8 TaxID=2827955 RepID=A0A8S5SRL3_9CAUD|nr:MAG TPA: hypothetical protein [Siphoviridae sp. ctrap8]
MLFLCPKLNGTKLSGKCRRAVNGRKETMWR